LRFGLICFDLDGTLVDSVKDIRAALVVALAEVGPADRARDEHALSSAGLGLPLDEFFALARPAPHPAALDGGYARFVAAYRAHYHANLLAHTRPFSGIPELLARLDELRARGLRTAVATTKRTDTARRVVSGLGLSRHFDFVSGTEGMPHKPKPDLLLHVARTVERDPRCGLMIGDTGRDVEAGRAAGMATCGVTWGNLGRAGLAEFSPDRLVDRCEEIDALLVDWGA
jgi:phosphoglycolate phosphatase